MKEDTSEQTKSRSLSWRLALTQVWQLLGNFLKTNLFIVLAFFLCLVLWSEYQAVQVVDQLQATPPQKISQEHVEVRTVSQPYGLHWQDVDSDNPYLQSDSYRRMISRPAHSPFATQSWLKKRSFPVYQVFFPQGLNTYWEVNFYWDTAFTFFTTAMLALVLLQLLSLPFAMVRSRNRMRQALQPIYELTAAAQNISVASERDMYAPLSGTIDELDAITGSHFDRRITISGEREELQGLAQAINNMLDRLDASYQAQVRFVSDASHELRTPISIVQGYAQLLNRWGKDDPQTLQESIDAIQSEAEYMQVLVEQLLFLARTDNQSLTLQVENLNLSAFLEEIAAESQMLSENHEIAESILPDIELVADPHLLKQAVRILMENAIKYTPEGGRITLSLEETPEEVEISVGDNGPGIAPQDLEHLFDRFWRADESRARKTGGTGLGLSIARWVVETHQGYLTVVSREDVGSRFTIHLPKGKFAPPLPLKPPPSSTLKEASEDSHPSIEEIS